MSQHATSDGGQVRVNRTPTVLAVVAVVLALVAAVIAVFALVQGGSDDDGPTYGDAQRNTDTRTVCDAFTVNLRAVSTQTGSTPSGGVAGESAAAANARLALFAASVNLTDALDSAPAARDELRSAVTELAQQYRTVATQYLAGAGADAPAVTGAIRGAGTAATAVTNACK